MVVDGEVAPDRPRSSPPSPGRYAGPGSAPVVHVPDVTHRGHTRSWEAPDAAAATAYLVAFAAEAIHAA
jgi:hypothetical protein